MKNIRPANWAGDRYINSDLVRKYSQPDSTGCILWTGSISRIGYGLVGFTWPRGQRGKSGKKTGMMSAHRACWQLHHRRVPAQANINHSCHIKNCVNPDHLIEGTQEEKLEAMREDGIVGGRKLGITGFEYNHQQHGRTYKYSPADLIWIRTASIKEIQIRYNLTNGRAGSFRRAVRHGYKWLPCDVRTGQSIP